ncbi:MAG: cation transporting ATPase C-terminal domain-containing protein, partial [Pseudohongiellaceae bacterium]
LGMTLPITPLQILWINMITAVTLGIALAFEPAEGNTMRFPPRPRNEPLLSPELIWHIVLVATVFMTGVFGVYLWALDQEYSLELARTMAMSTLVMMEIFHLFSIRSLHGRTLWEALRGIKMLWIAVIMVIGGQFSVTNLTPLQALFDTQALSMSDAGLIVSIGVASFTIIGLEQQIRLRLSHRRKG